LEEYMKKRKGKGLPESEVRHFLKRLVNAFRLMKSKDIVHSDLKLANILVNSDGVIKIVDFGFGKKLAERESAYTKIGTPLYAAPELMLDPHHTSTVDMWSLGVVLFKLLAGFSYFPLSDKNNDTEYPSDPVNRNTLQNLYTSGRVVRVSGCSNEINDFIFALLKTHTERISWQEFFSHPVLRDTISFPYTPASTHVKKKTNDNSKKLKKQITEYKNADIKQKEELQELKGKLESIVFELEKLKRELKDKEGEVITQSQEKEYLKKENAKLLDKVEDSSFLTGQLENEKIRADRSENELASMSQDLEQLKKENKALKKSNQKQMVEALQYCKKLNEKVKNGSK